MHETTDQAEPDAEPTPAETPSSAPDRLVERASDLVALACVVGSFALAMSVTQGTWFYVDEWSAANRGLTPVDVLRPYNGHLSVGFLVTYRIHFGLFGFEHHVLLRIIAYACLAAIPGALYLTTKARWGAPMAAGVAAITAWTRVPGLDPGSMNHWTTLVAGIVGAWALPRSGRRADLVVGLALVAAFLSAGGSVVFALAFGVHTVLTRAPIGRWVAVGLPSLAWAVWYAVVGRTQPRIPEFARLSPGELVELQGRGLAATFKAVGFGSPVLGIALGVGYALLVVHRLRSGRAAVATVAGFGLAVVAWWLSLGYSRGVIAFPDTTRYRLFTVVLLVLAVVPGPGERRERTWLRAPRLAPVLAAAALALVLVIGNAPTFRDEGDRLVVAAEVARRHADIRATSVGRVPIDDPYLALVLGSLTPDQLDAAFDHYDYDRPATPEALDVSLVEHGGASAVDLDPPDRQCTVLAAPVVDAQDGLVVWAEDGPVTVEVRRFGDAWVPFDELDAGEALRLRFAGDSSTRPWQVRADGGCA